MSGTRVYLGRLAGSARERDVERFFKNYGKIREMVLKEGFGFIVSGVHVVIRWRANKDLWNMRQNNYVRLWIETVQNICVHIKNVLNCCYYLLFYWTLSLAI